MWIQKHPAMTGVITAALLIGCADTAPIGPDATPFEHHAASSANDWVVRVTAGGAAFDPGTNQLNNGRANVTRYADGTVEGEFALRGRIPKGQNELELDLEFDVVAEADCLEVDGNMIWISGRLSKVRRFDIPGIPPQVPGDPLMAVVIDNGPADDLGFFNVPAAFGVEDCTGRPPFPDVPGIEPVRGNWTVHRR